MPAAAILRPPVYSRSRTTDIKVVQFGRRAMRILVAGATGVIGRYLVPLLMAAGHSVFALSRSAKALAAPPSAQLTPLAVDALDPAAVMTVFRRVAPDVVVHQLTSIPPRFNFRRFDQIFAATNRLRREGTDNLLTAARQTRVRLFVAQSFAGWPYARVGGAVKSEQDALDPDPPPAFRDALSAIRHLEAAVTADVGPAGVVLRYGALYGPGTSIGAGGSALEDIRRRRVPIVGDGGGVWSFVHVEDAAQATLQAIQCGLPGIYNIVDDEPARVSVWLPALADALGAKPPRHVPAWLARLAVGEHGVMMMTEVRGAANAKARSALAWEPRWKSWREGFRLGLGCPGATLPS